MKNIVMVTLFYFCVFSVMAEKKGPTIRPNIILMMADDLGYADTGFNGSKVVQTPNLDQLCNDGIRFIRFFSGAPVCSPTRGTCFTGRHHYRYGIWKANSGHLPKQEITIPKVLHNNGYATAHFGKWHLGIPNKNYMGKGGGEKNYCPPEWFGFDEYFVTHHAVKLYNPYGANGEKAKTDKNPYWHNGERVTRNVNGDDNRIIMDRVVPWLQNQAENDSPFFMVLWWHTPHAEVDASPKFRALYAELPEKQQKYYGAISAMDEQVGRMMSVLKKSGQLKNTMILFCSDNGPVGVGSAGDFKGRKGQLYNGGVTVPAFWYWPGKIQKNEIVEMPCSTLDYLPTLFDILGLQIPNDRPIDGISLKHLIDGEMTIRSKAIPFRFENSRGGTPTGGLIGDHYKFLTWFDENGLHDLLFDIDSDMQESNNIIEQNPVIASKMKRELASFLESAQKSHDGYDYKDLSFKPVDEWLDVNRTKRIKKEKKKNKGSRND